MLTAQFFRVFSSTCTSSVKVLVYMLHPFTPKRISLRSSLQWKLVQNQPTFSGKGRRKQGHPAPRLPSSPPGRGWDIRPCTPFPSSFVDDALMHHHPTLKIRH